VRQRFGGLGVFADDEEYSVIPTEVVRGWCAAATCFVCEYFEAALADAPASARPCASRTIANITMKKPRNLCIPASIRSETTQTEQLWSFPIDDSLRRLVVPGTQDAPDFLDVQ
jgi:hypothetical protein